MKNNLCKICGKSFTNMKVKAFCSPECNKKFHNKDKVTIKCSFCGKELIKSPSKVKTNNYCSNTCRAKHTNTHVTKKCTVCNKKYEVYLCRDSLSSYCSRKCMMSDSSRFIRQGNGLKLNYDQVKLLIEREGYTLLSTEYIDSGSKLNMKCDKGHEYSVCWDNFKQGHRCPHCSPHYSKAEKSIVSTIRERLPELKILENDRSVLNPKELDIYFPDKKLALEYCGLYWHSEKFAENNAHREKLDLCIKQGIRLITIFEDEWLNKPAVCLSRIFNALGESTSKIPARKTTLKQVSYQDATEFCNKHHLQNKSVFKVAFGLYHKEDLIQLMTLGKLSRQHTSNNNLLELKRLVSLPGYSVIGGASKLFKECKKYAEQNGYNGIRSYNDLRWGNYTQNIYKSLGFVKNGESRYTPHYISKDYKVRHRNQGLRKTKEERLTGKTEWELRKDQGYHRIHDCGHQTWDYFFNPS